MHIKKQEIMGYWIPVLHAHLPFVKHPEYDYFLEEHWLFQAISESYIPLLMNMKKMTEEDIDFRLTVSLSPTLLEMFADEHLVEKYLVYLEKLVELSTKEIDRLKNDNDLLPVAHFYKKRYQDIKSFFISFLNYNLLNGFRYFCDLGKIEIITSCATHGFLPLLRNNPRTVEAQISIAVNAYTRHLGKRPNGIWLPECAYYEGLDKILSKYDLRFFFLDSHGLMNGKPVPKYGVYAPVYTINGVAVFGRDPVSSKQVWSAEEGYPGDYYYRDFYRDVGFDLEFDYIKPYISPDGARAFTGIKYYRISGTTDRKEPYDLLRASEKVDRHAAHFCSERRKQFETLSVIMDRPPAVLSPYDAELFGHWWFEGTDFLYKVFREISNSNFMKAITPSEYLGMHPDNQVISPGSTSWGDKGYFDAWLNNENDWIYRHLHYMAETMENLADEYNGETDLSNIRLLNQLARELLLAQSSDWAFLITTNTAKDYSIRRVKEHVWNFNKLHDDLESKNVDMKLLNSLENKNSIFNDLDFRVFAK